MALKGEAGGETNLRLPMMILSCLERGLSLLAICSLCFNISSYLGLAILSSMCFMLSCLSDFFILFVYKMIALNAFSCNSSNLTATTDCLGGYTFSVCMCIDSA